MARFGFLTLSDWDDTIRPSLEMHFVEMENRIEWSRCFQKTYHTLTVFFTR